jgi:hypothetical protein
VEDQSTGLPLEASLLRSAHALERWCGVLAMPPLSWVSQGPSVVQRGKRRLVEPQGLRGASSLKSGWPWGRDALRRGDELISSV